MTEMTQEMIVLSLFAFMIGFALIHLWRRDAYTRKYEAQLASLEEEQAETVQRLQDTEQKAAHTQATYDKAHQAYLARQQQQGRLRGEEAELMEHVTQLEAQYETLQHKTAQEEAQIGETQARIAALTEELDHINTAKETLAAHAAVIANLKAKLAEHESLIQSYLQENETLKKMRKALREEAQALDGKIFDLKAQIHQEAQKIGKIESKYAKRLKKLESDAEALKVKALNYTYAAKEFARARGDAPIRVGDKLVQRLFRMPKSIHGEIDAVIRKAEKRGWIERIKARISPKNIADKEQS